ncbi:hypothetical protein HB364_21080 [Pseudoflavitalea sp. X16]|uniref:hypothetical protein n=1 Tax=Paraflavitalea devenefica TaxID=2716334 RepID=UPI00141F4D67|nr:hypothetical protein [Paraflavitalea devenefica]NII27590.1 hypothetical protein [Paraflavitalea devenefica]
MALERRKANTIPLSWSPEDERLLLKYLKKESFDAQFLMELFPGRTLPGIRSKVRKLRIKHDLFGESYRDQKEDFTTQIARKVKPKHVFDAYAGAGHQTFKWTTVADVVYASDIMKSKLKQFEKTARENKFEKVNTGDCLWKLFTNGDKKVFFFMGDALDAAADLKVNKLRIDLVDLDTCGSTLPILPTLLVLLKPRHIVITHGEFHSMRFKREDVLRRLFLHRDISKNPFPMDVETMSNELDKAVKIAGLRAHNETTDSFWLDLKEEKWLGGKFHGMLRRYYKVSKPSATADCINELSKI